jgi:glycosyltransferase involved in cell wall biosynthesis
MNAGCCSDCAIPIPLSEDCSPTRITPSGAASGSQRRARRQEARLLSLFTHILVSSGDEFVRYKLTSPGCDRFVHLPWPRPAVRPRDVQDGVFDAGFIGSESVMNVEAMMYFINGVLPEIRRRLPDFRFLIAGKVASVVPRLMGSPEHIVFAPSPQELDQFYGSIKVAVVPLLTGSGTSVKTVEALCFGCPVVTTPVGARGLELRNEEHLVIAADPIEFAESVVSLTQNQGLRRRLGDDGRKHVITQHSQERYLDVLDGLIKRAFERKSNLDHQGPERECV